MYVAAGCVCRARWRTAWNVAKTSEAAKQALEVSGRGGEGRGGAGKGGGRLRAGNGKHADRATAVRAQPERKQERSRTQPT